MAREPLRRRGLPNATTRTGKVVHAAGRHGYPDCGAMRMIYFVGHKGGVWYTDEPVNCEGCNAGWFPVSVAAGKLDIEPADVIRRVATGNLKSRRGERDRLYVYLGTDD